MNSERWQQIERLYHEALERESPQRAAFLAEACGGEDELRAEVESLLAQALLIAAGAVKWLPRAAAAPIRSIAVLPLANLSGDPNQEYFSDATTEALISSLAQIHSLEGIAPKVMRYEGTRKTAREIGQELGADAVVEGSPATLGKSSILQPAHSHSRFSRKQRGGR